MNQKINNNDNDSNNNNNINKSCNTNNNDSEQSDFLNLFQSIDLKENDKKKKLELYFQEIRKQYQNTLINGDPFNNTKDIDWISNTIRTLNEFKLSNKDEKKELIKWIFKNLIIPVDSLRLKYKDQQQQQQQQQAEEGVTKNRTALKLWEYQLQIILRFEYLYLKEKLYEKKKLETTTTKDEDKNINSSIENIVFLLQDVSFLMDSFTNIPSNTTTTTTTPTTTTISSPPIINQGFINFLEVVILPRYISELKPTLIIIYKLLEISKPKQLKKEKPNKIVLNSNTMNELIQENPDIDSTINIDLNKDDDFAVNSSKKKKKEGDDKTVTKTAPSVSAGLPKDLFKNRSVKKLNHFTMSLSNPSKSFRTISTTSQQQQQQQQQQKK
ncbi:hypothetical protein DICPUDRAFT_78139 [Dictyostelium purpureum]|uniref:Uncharacterized protein n=1 Tax=Dictyostelium purpureum TaxID=5786 RepID=F0ZIN6_DICPU|nr:uncharacterized protein DICPUDRAFT_78139 [Dictyostelium purpureum]EGC36200.1 hypothetical protein DICPUDRAFT_78139 [Dictyostelium purpureum]|eukprot:XP_003287267.1 hypothetical protein DICPUDRAFT_78139 [Dictyostelium purpureum]